MWDEQRDFWLPFLKRERNIFVKTIQPNQNTAYMLTPPPINSTGPRTSACGIRRLILPSFVSFFCREMELAVNDDFWYHICTTWENADGSWNFYVDGQLWENGDGLETGHVIDNNGIFILGQDQDSYGGGFEQSQSFFGQLYGVNMWNRVLSPDEISHMSTNCSYGVGNYLRWSDFVTGLHGGVTMTSPATCSPWTVFAC